MMILVTGSNGFIGAHLVRELLEQGHQVRAFHRLSSPLRLLESAGQPVEHALGDLTQPETIQAAMEGIEVVFHTAAWMGGHDQPGRQYAVTVEGTRNVMQAARKAGVKRVIHTSSAAALGVPRDPCNPLESQLIRENNAWNYRPDYYPYGYAKYLAELEIQKAVAQGLDAVIVNPTLVFGGGDLYRQSSSLVTRVAERRLSVAVEGGINAVHIADVVDGHLAALSCGSTGHRYILGGENLTFLQLLQTIAEVTHVPAPNLVLPTWLVRSLSGPASLFKAFWNLPVSPDLLRLAGTYFYYDLRKAEGDLGLTHHRPLKDAITEAYDWFRQAL